MSGALVELHAKTDPIECLTERERSVFSLYAQGCGNQSIADQLNIPVKTAECSNKYTVEPHSTPPLDGAAVLPRRLI